MISCLLYDTADYLKAKETRSQNKSVFKGAQKVISFS